MAFKEKEVPANATRGQKMMAWIDSRFPLTATIEGHLTKYYAPKNFNFWYFFGSLAILVLAIQIITGIFLVMHYKPDAEKAFQSVEYIMREVPWGWLVRYMHSTGASMFFVVVYLHMFRGLIYGSYRKPRELVWIFGCAIFLCLMAEAFMGYLLPWGQMSYWGAQVIVNLFAAIPLVGPDLSLWIRGDYVVSDATLNRFFSFHVIAVPLVLIGLVAAHIVALHEVGSNNPDGIDIKEKKMTLPLIYALNMSTPKEKREIINIVKNHNTDNVKVKQVIETVIAKGGITYSTQKMNALKNQALSLLETFPPGQIRESLAGLVEYTIGRDI